MQQVRSKVHDTWRDFHRSHHAKLFYLDRYNKSGGCVCRHCRWVFCKEEKRKALQHIEHMIRSRPDGRVDPDEDIEGFVCSPKYWSCGRPWKVGWVLQQNNADDLDDDAMMLD